MAKRIVFHPLILLGDTPGDDSVIGGGSGQGGLTQPAAPMSYSDWLASVWKEDLIQDGTINEYDFAAWWEGWGFTKEAWDEYNPGLDWDIYFG